MKNRNITTENLARIIKVGFDDTEKRMDKGFKEINDHLNKIENIILKQHAHKIEYLEKRMHRLEDALNLK